MRRSPRSGLRARGRSARSQTGPQRWCRRVATSHRRARRAPRGPPRGSEGRQPRAHPAGADHAPAQRAAAPAPGRGPRGHASSLQSRARRRRRQIRGRRRRHDAAAPQHHRLLARRHRDGAGGWSIRTAAPRSRARRTSSRVASTPSGSTPSNGSSRSSTVGSWKAASSTDRRRPMPWENPAVTRSAAALRSKRSSRSRARSGQPSSRLRSRAASCRCSHGVARG